MRSPELPALAALVIFSVLLTLHTQIRMRNVPVLVSGTVITISGTVYLVNSLVWAGNVRDVAPIWCDIGTS
jgi:pheromone a factor receptor